MQNSLLRAFLLATCRSCVLLQEEEAAKVHAKFVDALAAAEREIELRNQMDLPPNAAPYTLLMPSNPPTAAPLGGRPPGRGIPMSISI